MVREADGTTDAPWRTAPAAAPYLLDVYRGTPGVTGELVSNAAIAGAELTWTAPPLVPAGADYDVLVVNPLGWRSAVPRAVKPLVLSAHGVYASP